MQTEYCCRLKKKGLNDHIHMHQPGQGLESFSLVPIFSSDEIASYEHDEKLSKDHRCGAVNQTRPGVACNVESKSIRIPRKDREMNPTSPNNVNCKCM